MKSNNRLKPVALFLMALLLFQSCVVYHKTPTTLEKATQERIRTKVTNASGKALKFTYIAYEDDVYYGINERSNLISKTPINQQETAKVLTKNKPVSVLVTVGFICLIIVAPFAYYEQGHKL